MILGEAAADEHLDLEVNWRSFEYYPALARVRRFIEESYDGDLSLPVIARVAGMEASYFSVFFHRKIGVRLTDWIWHVRISMAQRILSSTNQPISVTAYSVGFADLRTFERAFKRLTKMTAREFKRRVRLAAPQGPPIPAKIDL
jgi:two-component system response regulator YesN